MNTATAPTPGSAMKISDGLTRRDFVSRSAVAAAGGLLAIPGWVGAQAPAKKIRVGIVGGRFGLGFQFHEHPDCIVEAVSDLVPERRAALQKTYKCAKAYDSLEELVKDPKVEAVALFTPVPDHARHVLLCLAAGKHVLCAVPVAMTLDECQQLADAVKKTGLTYMMAETSHWQQLTISARKFHQEGAFGNLYYTESEYHHPGLEELYFNKDGSRTWRHGIAPMQYPTHCTSHLISVTGERLTEVTCHGWGDNDPIVKDNVYKNPFWNETALFKTNKGNAMRVAVWWRGAQTGGERARFYGDKMSFYYNGPNGAPTCTVRSQAKTEKDSGGFVRSAQVMEKFEEVQWWKTDLLPEPMRHNSGHEGSHCFITHEFIDALVKQRKPAVDIYEAIAYTAPGIVAHQSALKGGESMKIPQFDPT
ncbi:Gfo/Idh/MocA family oxidoreductase [Roseimicrobium sp. ORNL1]|uniref:Gfo/Idh/MocA family protein n=1 Tax=Roseimicrobium sp. ORNL1 TaxID=2711231 RepID=UPI001F0F25FE|nr:Gfo/Idh/MocA family oxidoreductase [Roseimicrobium sp. ORNL1]